MASKFKNRWFSSHSRVLPFASLRGSRRRLGCARVCEKKKICFACCLADTFSWLSFILLLLGEQRLSLHYQAWDKSTLLGRTRPSCCQVSLRRSKPKREVHYLYFSFLSLRARGSYGALGSLHVLLEPR